MTDLVQETIKKENAMTREEREKKMCGMLEAIKCLAHNALKGNGNNSAGMAIAADSIIFLAREVNHLYEMKLSGNEGESENE